MAGHTSQNSAQPSPSVTTPNTAMKMIAEDHRDRQHDEVDQEREHPPRQHAAKQFRLQIGIERMRRHAAVVPPGAASIERRLYCPNRYKT